MTFESYYEQIKDFDWLGLPPSPDDPQDISANDIPMMIDHNFCAKPEKNEDLTGIVFEHT